MRGRSTIYVEFDKCSKALRDHIGCFKEIIDNSNDYPPYVHRPRDSKIFLGEKIVCPQRSRSNTFGYNDEEWFALTDVFVLTSKKDSPYSLKTILGVLCSKTTYYWLYYRGKRKGEMLELIQTPVAEIPLPNFEKLEAARIEKLVSEIIAKGRDSKKEAEIERAVASAFGLNAKEQSEVIKFYNEHHADLEAKSDSSNKKAA